jgi:hypothetical protein
MYKSIEQDSTPLSASDISTHIIKLKSSWQQSIFTFHHLNLHLNVNYTLWQVKSCENFKTKLQNPRMIFLKSVHIH